MIKIIGIILAIIILIISLIIIIHTLYVVIAHFISHYDYVKVCTLYCKQYYNSTYKTNFGLSWRFQGNLLLKNYWHGCNGCICGNGEFIPVHCYD